MPSRPASSTCTMAGFAMPLAGILRRLSANFATVSGTTSRRNALNATADLMQDAIRAERGGRSEGGGFVERQTGKTVAHGSTLPTSVFASLVVAGPPRHRSAPAPMDPAFLRGLRSQLRLDRGVLRGKPGATGCVARRACPCQAGAAGSCSYRLRARQAAGRE